MATKIIWEDLENRGAMFTKRNASMVSLDTGKVIQQYSSNTRINVVQKAFYNGELYFRTATAKEKGLNWAFKASAFDAPNEKAPSAHSSKPNSLEPNTRNKGTSIPFNQKKQTSYPKVVSSKDGETKRLKTLFKSIFRRKNGTKNS